jgi:hypothetical protein
LIKEDKKLKNKQEKTLEIELELYMQRYMIIFLSQPFSIENAPDILDSKL